MKTVILTTEGRGDKSAGAWLRDLGFTLIEAGCEINIMKAEGDAARDILASKGLDVAQIVEGFAPSSAKPAVPPRKQSGERVGATASTTLPRVNLQHQGEYGESDDRSLS